MTHKERILMAARGEIPDVLPYVPRFDLWYNANSYADTLPPEHKGRTADEIARAEGWALHKVIPELLKVETPEENLHRGLGLYSLKENGYWIEFLFQRGHTGSPGGGYQTGRVSYADRHGECHGNHHRRNEKRRSFDYLA